MKENYFSEYAKIGMNIKKIRSNQEITQKRLSELTGLSLSYISKIEAANCNKSFSLDALFIIAEVLNVNVKELID